MIAQKSYPNEQIYPLTVDPPPRADSHPRTCDGLEILLIPDRDSYTADIQESLEDFAQYAKEIRKFMEL